MKLRNVDWAYVAGFLDGDGSIYIQLKPNSTYKYRFQVAYYVVFYQSSRKKSFLLNLNSFLGYGYVRDRDDGISEYIIGNVISIKNLLHNVLPYLRLKKGQAELMLNILNMKKNVKSANNFVSLAKKIDKFRLLNYSKKRKYDAELVKKVLKSEGLLTP